MSHLKLDALRVSWAGRGTEHDNLDVEFMGLEVSWAGRGTWDLEVEFNVVVVSWAGVLRRLAFRKICDRGAELQPARLSEVTQKPRDHDRGEIDEGDDRSRKECLAASPIPGVSNKRKP